LPKQRPLLQGESEEYIPLREYLLRHDKAIFWVIESMIPFGNHPLFLFFLGWMLPPKPAFMKLTTTPVGKLFFPYICKLQPDTLAGLDVTTHYSAGRDVARYYVRQCADPQLAYHKLADRQGAEF
jgi:hypothetical protein